MNKEQIYGIDKEKLAKDAEYIRNRRNSETDISLNNALHAEWLALKTILNCLIPLEDCEHVNKCFRCSDSSLEDCGNCKPAVKLEPPIVGQDYAVQPEQGELYGKSVGDLDRQRIEKENIELNISVDKQGECDHACDVCQASRSYYERQAIKDLSQQETECEHALDTFCEKCGFTQEHTKPTPSQECKHAKKGEICYCEETKAILGLDQPTLWEDFYAKVHEVNQRTLSAKQMAWELKDFLKQRLGEKLEETPVEELAVEFHEVYQKELHRQGRESKHSDVYDDLPEDIKDLDRALARYVNAKLAELRKWLGL